MSSINEDIRGKVEKALLSSLPVPSPALLLPCNHRASVGVFLFFFFYSLTNSTAKGEIREGKGEGRMMPVDVKQSTPLAGCLWGW